jgi:hypothetical protein
MAENKFDNSGNFTGASIIQGSTIYNAGQIAGTLVKADDASRKQLQALIGQLAETVRAVPPESKDEVEALGASAEDLMKEASKEAPNKSRLRALGASLLGMAGTVGAAAPAALAIAGNIVDLVGKIHGLV